MWPLMQDLLRWCMTLFGTYLSTAHGRLIRLEGGEPFVPSGTAVFHSSISISCAPGSCKRTVLWIPFLLIWFNHTFTCLPFAETGYKYQFICGSVRMKLYYIDCCWWCIYYLFGSPNVYFSMTNRFDVTENISTWYHASSASQCW